MWPDQDLKGTSPRPSASTSTERRGPVSASATSSPAQPPETTSQFLSAHEKSPSSRALIKRISISQMRPFRQTVPPQNTIRVVNPDPPAEGSLLASSIISTPATSTSDVPKHHHHRGENNHSGNIATPAYQPILSSAQSSPMPTHASQSVMSGAATTRRQGRLINETRADSVDTTTLPSNFAPHPTVVRSRTHTLDSTFHQPPAHSAAGSLNAVGGSISSAASSILDMDIRGPRPQPSLESLAAASSTTPSTTTTREKKMTGTRIVKRGSRPATPVVLPPPTVDTLPAPIPTDDANGVLMLMRSLAGKMRGYLEYKSAADTSWYLGLCYIDYERECLVLDSSDIGPCHISIVPDLRGCRVMPVEGLATEKQQQPRCLEIRSPYLTPEVYLRPLSSDKFDYWLAALLCWQQLRPSSIKLSPPLLPPPPLSSLSTWPSNAHGQDRDMKRWGPSTGLKESSIIKVGKVSLWDKGTPMSPRAVVEQESARHSRSTHTWRPVSCILQDNGDFKLIAENDVTVLSIISLSQLSRHAIQRLDKSVLQEKYCIAIFPIYALTSTHITIFRPVYIALDSRVLFEVWFVLLRAFTVPELFVLGQPGSDQVDEVVDLDTEPSGVVFRVEKSINVRVVEAKLYRAPRPLAGKGDADGLVGNYVAEVILDGEVRARTKTKLDTKNPFWREDCEFVDLPWTSPYLSILLKRVDGHADTSNSTPPDEVVWGSVDLSLHGMEHGKDDEKWLQIYGESHQSIGSMLVKLQREELIVLLAQEYQPLLELLHRFGSGMPAQIADAFGGNPRALAEVFVDIFQVSGSVTEWLFNLVEDEVEGMSQQQAPVKKSRFNQRLKSNESLESSSDREHILRDLTKSRAGEANLLFRGNTLLTHAIECHMRRLGKEYLEEVLLDKVVEIEESNPDCEVDPSKLGPGEDVQVRWQRLLGYMQDVWACIANSGHRLPPELRHILKHVRSVSENRYGDFLRTVTYTSVSSFLFLRFLCPAVLNPKLFGLLRDHPRPRAQRTLTLIAKGLQVLANLANVGKKESWIEPMTSFITAQRASLKAYIDTICGIPAERAQSVLPPSYSTPVAMMSRASRLMREGFPSVPYLIDDARALALLVRMWDEAHGSTHVSAFESDELRQFHEIALSLHAQSTECHRRIENLRLMEELSQATEDCLSENDVHDHDHAALDTRADSTPYHTASPSGTDSDIWPFSSPLGSDLDGPIAMRPPLPLLFENDSSHHSRRDTRRQASGDSDSSGSVLPPLGTSTAIRSTTGKTTRNKFLTGFKRMAKGPLSPDTVTSSPLTMATRTPTMKIPGMIKTPSAHSSGLDGAKLSVLTKSQSNSHSQNAPPTPAMSVTSTPTPSR